MRARVRGDGDDSWPIPVSEGERAVRWARARADARLASWPKRGGGARAAGKRASWAGAWVACGEGNGPRGEGEWGAGWAERFVLGWVSGFLLFLDFPNLFLFLF